MSDVATMVVRLMEKPATHYLGSGAPQFPLRIVSKRERLRLAQVEFNDRKTKLDGIQFWEIGREK